MHRHFPRSGMREGQGDRHQSQAVHLAVLSARHQARRQRQVAHADFFVQKARRDVAHHLKPSTSAQAQHLLGCQADLLPTLALYGLGGALAHRHAAANQVVEQTGVHRFVQRTAGDPTVAGPAL